MEEKGILKHWWLPKEGVNDWSKEYKNRPVGNSPEMMPLDTSLNRDVHAAVSRHAALTDKMDTDNPKKFARGTPSRLSESCFRVWRGGGGRGAAKKPQKELKVARCGEHSDSSSPCRRHVNGHESAVPAGKAAVCCVQWKKEW